MLASDPVFLTLAEVVETHTNQVQLYGGSQGVRDLALLESALAQPQSSFGGQWLHGDLFEMAAAYAFHLTLNHPFIDGNKRTALAATLVFLRMNGISLVDSRQKLLDAMMKLAKHRLTKSDFAEVLESLAQAEGQKG